MLFPWKRVKSTRISRLVNDQLHKSQKRRDGSSLVVETGFPTSLVDLFIKNREKLKSSKKKRRSPPLTPLTDANDPTIAEASVPFSSAPPSPCSMISLPIAGSPDPVNCPLECLPASPNSTLLPLISRDYDESLVVETSDGNAPAGVVDVKKDFFVFLKMFSVVILSLGSRRLTVGITVSAFLLLFLEFLAKHASGLLKPSADYERVLRWMVQRVVLLLGFKKVKLDEKYRGLSWMPELQQDPPLKHVSYSQKGFESRCLNQEIQMAEAKDYLLAPIEGIQPDGEITAENCIEVMPTCQEKEPKESVVEMEGPKREVAEVKKCKSRRPKILLQMKKFFQKKPRRSRKEVASCGKQIIDECLDEVMLEGVSELSSISSARNTGIEEDEMSTLLALDGLPEVNEETSTENQDQSKEIKTGSTWSYLVLCLIVLIGLIGGRAFALLLTLLWYLLLKLSGKLPIVRSFDDKSS